MSGLPLIKHSVFTTELPSTKKKIKYRMFTAEEEKILLMAMQSGEKEDIANAMIQIIQNCIVDKDVDVRTLATFDIEWLFVQLRKVSVNNVITLSFKDSETGEFVKDIEIDLNDVKVNRENEISNLIHVQDDIKLVMKYPSIALATEFDDGTVDMHDIIYRTMDSIVSGEEIIKLNNIPKEEAIKWIANLPSKTTKDIREFFKNSPSIYIDIEYEINNKKKTHRVSGITNFFT